MALYHSSNYGLSTRIKVWKFGNTSSSTILFLIMSWINLSTLPTFLNTCLSACPISDSLYRCLAAVVLRLGVFPRFSCGPPTRLNELWCESGSTVA